MSDDRKHQILRLSGTTDALPEYQLRNAIFNLDVRLKSQGNPRADTDIVWVPKWCFAMEESGIKQVLAKLMEVEAGS